MGSEGKVTGGRREGNRERRQGGGKEGMGSEGKGTGREGRERREGGGRKGRDGECCEEGGGKGSVVDKTRMITLSQYCTTITAYIHIQYTHTQLPYS